MDRRCVLCHIHPYMRKGSKCKQCFYFAWLHNRNHILRGGWSSVRRIRLIEIAEMLTPCFVCGCICAWEHVRKVQLLFRAYDCMLIYLPYFTLWREKHLTIFKYIHLLGGTNMVLKCSHISVVNDKKPCQNISCQLSHFCFTKK